MSSLEIAWGVALIVTLGALPAGIVRTVAYRSGEIDHTRTMRIAATVALTLGLAGLVALVALSVALGLARG
ncbi:hypothetical protein [Nocardioides sp.]|uniref:hypothetical protein n=1 Tax=Nocardioides sp. TaxID=35761 RepID=UPI002EDB5DCB